ncbi:LysR family transcriptional regulator [Pseudomonas sp. TH39(2020)]|uniref:LysR family transcriptional regulator n=1 Tax=Pseudomonas sp. TH39(2020) TaxID=2796349 RepID=UPI0019130935|nr:LysR family transcriptional regulator [Pseudomonas sp. TH39(2020)]MBK5395954.1 LysR family transcriptional regulator [Pseudomonas sp. TH39(2020)]
MNHEHLRVLVEIARLGSFSQVAKQRDLDPSAVSRIVQSVERDLGVRLFQRSTRQVSLTEAGGTYLARIAHLLEELDAASDEVKSAEQRPSGILKVTASVAFGQACLVPLVPEFIEMYPDVQLELLLTDTNVDLIAERVDLALRVSPHMAQDMVRLKWFDAAYTVCVAPSYIRNHPTVSVVEDLANHRHVLFGYPQPQSLWIVTDEGGVEHRISAQAAVVSSSGLAQRELAISGVGPALMPIWLAAPALKSGALVELLPHCSITPSNFSGAAWLLYPNRKFLPSRTRVMLDFLLKHTMQCW